MSEIVLPPVEEADIPADESPDIEVSSTGDFDPDYPGSTPDAPYGFKPNGEPYKRRPNKSGTRASSGVTKSPANDSLARSAAGVLSTMNILVGMSISAFGMTQTSESIVEANKRFEVMAVDALRNDPALCRKILSAGTSSGKAQLAMAYGTLALAVFPAAKNDVQMLRSKDDE